MSSNVDDLTIINGHSYSFENHPQPILIRISPQKKVVENIFPKHGTNTLFRSATSSQDQIFFSGHYNDSLSIYDQKVTNDGEHGIFLFRKKI